MVVIRALLITSLTFSWSVQAEDISGAVIKDQLQTTKTKLLKSEERQRSIMSSLFDINKKMKKLVSERSKTDEKRMALESSTRELAEKIVELEQKMKSQRSLLQIRLRAIYRFGGQGFARFLFSSSDSAQLERNLKIMGIVAARDLALMHDYSGMVKELETKRSHFMVRLASLKKTQQRVSDQERLIASESQTKAKILDRIRRTKMKALAKLRKLRETSGQASLGQDDELLDLLLKPPFFEKKGILQAPVQGSIARRFGIWKDPQFNVTMNHKGIFYRTDAVSPVSAIFPGKVAFRGDIDGFGPTLILDHGDHYYSVYSGLSDVRVPAGTEVQEGQKIASVNDGSYFEIRHFSEPYDPQKWMKGQQP